MKPVFYFSYNKRVWLKISICIVSGVIILCGVYAVYSISYSTWLLYRCQKYIAQLSQNCDHATKDTTNKIKKSITDHVFLKKKYEKRLNQAYRFFDWCITILTLLNDDTILEQLTIAKKKISCDIITPNTLSLHDLTKMLLAQLHCKEVIIQSYQKTVDNTLHASLSIIQE